MIWDAIPEGKLLVTEHINLRFFQNSSAVASPREAVLITNRTPPDGGSNLVLQWLRWSEKEATNMA